MTSHQVAVPADDEQAVVDAHSEADEDSEISGDAPRIQDVTEQAGGRRDGDEGQDGGE